MKPGSKGAMPPPVSKLLCLCAYLSSGGGTVAAETAPTALKKGISVAPQCMLPEET